MINISNSNNSSAPNGDTNLDCSLIGSLVSFFGPWWTRTVSSLGSGKINIWA